MGAEDRRWVYPEGYRTVLKNNRAQCVKKNVRKIRNIIRPSPTRHDSIFADTVISFLVMFGCRSFPRAYTVR